MIMTIQNNHALTPLVVEFRGLLDQTTIAAAGGTATFGCTMLDIEAQADKGNPAWKYLDNLIKTGVVAITFATDATQQSVVDAANEV